MGNYVLIPTPECVVSMLEDELAHQTGTLSAVRCNWQKVKEHSTGLELSEQGSQLQQQAPQVRMKQHKPALLRPSVMRQCVDHGRLNGAVSPVCVTVPHPSSN